MYEPVKLIIDTDPGIDDAMAIHLAFADPRFEVLGLSSIFGNVHTKTASRNALYLAEMAAYHCDVAAGVSAPMVQAQQPVSDFVHGKEGFGTLSIKPSDKPLHPLPAPEYLIEKCREAPQEVTICALGPLTNLAAAIRLDADFPKYVKKLVMMGGAVYCKGNVNDYAEANIWNDPDAAELVFRQSWDMELIGLDVTSVIRSTPDDFIKLAQQAPLVGGFLNEALQFYFDFYQTRLPERMCMMHDPSAVLSIVEPHWFKYDSLALKTICASDQPDDKDKIGQTIPLNAEKADGRPKIKVAVSVKADKIKKSYFNISGTADQRRLQRLSML